MIYFIEAVGVGSIKIGFTESDDACDRMATLQTGSPCPLRLLGTIPGTYEDEKNLHRRFGSSRVQGEWFKAVPELIAMIPTKDVRVCGGVEVAERSVSLRVLTVGRKQFSKNLLEQIPQSSSVNWRGLVDAIIEDDPEDERPVGDFVIGDVWGWTAAPDRRNEHDNPYSTRYVVFEVNGRLFKDQEVNSRAEFVRPKCYKAPELQDAWETAFNVIQREPGFRPEDQLFFGV